MSAAVRDAGAAVSANRTPSPWEYKHLGAHHFAIQCIDGQIAKLSVPISANTETVEANAAFIVKACNAHDDLVAALKDIAGGFNVSAEVNAALMAGNKAAFQEAFGTWMQQRAREALAKAGAP